MINVYTFEPPEYNRSEILRYAKASDRSAETLELMESCIKEADPLLTFRVSSTILPISFSGDELVIGNIHTKSNVVKKALDDCFSASIFAATVGIGLDRLIMRYSRVSPAKALMLHAIGAERVESLCDAFCDKLSRELSLSGKRLKPRVSPGYGDIPMDMQRDIFALLDCPRKIGVSLGDDLLMTPSKSVTAVMGITDI